MEETTEPTKLHFTRVRSKGDSTFYDPQSDIRVIMPTAAKMTADILMQTSQDEWIKRVYSYIAKCYSIFQIRLAEDSTDLVTQVNDFTAAINKADPVMRTMWFQTMFTLMNTLYALFTRRDAKTDGAEIRGMLNTAQQATLLSLLSQEQANEIKDSFQRAGLAYQEKANILTDAMAVCEETEEVIHNLKDLAEIFISHSGPGDWHSMAKACDEFYMSAEADKLDDRAKLAVALAYPDYETPYLDAEATSDQPS